MSEGKKQPPTDPVEAAFAKLGHKRVYGMGDIVRWEGELWRVDGWRFDATRGYGEEYEDIEYSLVRVFCDGTHNDFAEVYQGDESLRLSCYAEYAAGFIAEIAQYEGVPDGHVINVGEDGIMPAMMTNGSGDSSGGKRLVPKQRVSRAKEWERSELKRRADWKAKSDAMLDEFNACIAAGDADGAKRVMTEWRERARIHEAGGCEIVAEIFIDGSRSTDGMV